jgi:hypothetical protein
MKKIRRNNDMGKLVEDETTIQVLVADLGLAPGPALDAATKYCLALMKNSLISDNTVKTMLKAYYDGYQKRDSLKK